MKRSYDRLIRKKYNPKIFNQIDSDDLKLLENYGIFDDEEIVYVLEIPYRGDSSNKTLAYIKQIDDEFLVCVEDEDAQVTYSKTFKSAKKAQEEVDMLGENSFSLIDLGLNMKNYTV